MVCSDFLLQTLDLFIQGKAQRSHLLNGVIQRGNPSLCISNGLCLTFVVGLTPASHL